MSLVLDDIKYGKAKRSRRFASTALGKMLSPNCADIAVLQRVHYCRIHFNRVVYVPSALPLVAIAFRDAEFDLKAIVGPLGT